MTKQTQVSRSDVIAACRVAGKATEKVAVTLRSLMATAKQDEESRKEEYTALCALAMIVDDVKHTKAEMIALADKSFIRGYNALTSAWRELNKKARGPKVTKSFKETFNEKLQKALDFIQKAKPETLTGIDVAKQVAAIQTAFLK